MAESTDNSSPDQTKGLPVAAERTTQASRPISPLSGGSDNDGSERPVREKLKKTSIAGLSTHGKKDENVKADIVSADSSAGEDENGREDTMLTDTTPPSRGRPARKRSFDDLQNESVTSIDAPAQDDPTRPGGHHKRMRSRDMTFTKIASVNGRAGKEQVEPLAEEEHDVEAQKSPGGAGIMVEAPSIDDDDGAGSGNQSPKKKRSRDQFDKDHTAEGDALDEKENQAVVSDRDASDTENELSRTTTNGDKGEPDKKRHRDASQEGREAANVKQVERTSGFANTSIVSPFGTLASSKSPSTGKPTLEPEAVAKEKRQTSSSAFASSGLSAFSNSSKSPFGGLVGSSGPGSGAAFGSFGPKPSSGLGSSSGFGGASPFAAQAPSGFGSLGGTGFGSALGSGFGGSRTGMFGFTLSGGPIGVLGSGSLSKPFGKSEDDEENEDENDAGSSKADDEADERDSRFYEQQTETGEEAEETMFSCRAKLFHFEKEWKERGVGTVKLNIHYAVKEDPEEVPEQKARLIMRTDGVHRVVLNTPVFKGMKFGTPDGQEPTGKTLNLTGMENGKPALFLLRIGKEDVVKDLYHRISSIHNGL